MKHEWGRMQILEAVTSENLFSQKTEKVNGTEPKVLPTLTELLPLGR